MLNKSELQSSFQKLQMNDTLVWANINGQELQLQPNPNAKKELDPFSHLNKQKEETDITHFGFTVVDKRQEFGEDLNLSTLDLVYLLKLCQFENEARKINRLGLLGKKASSRPDGMKYVEHYSQNLHPQVPEIVANNSLFDLQFQLDRQVGYDMDFGEQIAQPYKDSTTELSDGNHGLLHLQATDDEL